MSYAQQIGYSSTISIDDVTTGTYVALANPISIDLPYPEVETIDVSSMGMSTRDRTFVTGLQKASVIKAEFFGNKNDILRCVGMQQVAGKHVKIVLPDDGSTSSGGLTVICSALLIKVTEGAKTAEATQYTVEWQPTGPITYS